MKLSPNHSATLPAALSAAALLAFSASALAQSSVTITGVADAAARYTSNSGGSIRSLASGSNSTSRLVFRGSEDLGGGYRAGFWLESSMQLDTGAASGGTQFWDRQATVMLSGPFGELRAGRDWTPVYWGFVLGDPWINVGVGSGSNFLNASVSTAYQRAFGSALNPTTLSRSNNAIEYWLPPNLGGLYGNVMIAPGEGNNAGGAFRYNAGRLGFRSGSFDVAAYGGTTRIDAASTNLKQVGVYGAYTVGPAALMMSMTNSSFLSSKQTHWMGGTRVTLGTWIIKASYNRLDQKGTNAAGTSIDANDASQFAIGADYLLSKRTALYATAAQLSNKGAARFAIPGGPAVFAAGTSSKGYELGMRHSF